MESIMFIYMMYIVVFALLNGLSEQLEIRCNNSNNSETERNKAQKKMSTLKKIKKIMTIGFYIYTILYGVLFLLTNIK